MPIDRFRKIAEEGTQLREMGVFGMRKSVVWLSACLLVVGLLSGCGGKKEDSGATSSPSVSNSSDSAAGGKSELSGKIKFLSHRTDYVNDGTFDKYIAKFKEKYPKAEIELEALTNYANDIKVRLTTGEAGDVLMLDPGIANKDLPTYFEPLPDSLFENAYFPDQRAWEGKRYAITTGVNTMGIVYNKKAFQKAGITKVPTTLDELYQAAQKLKDAGIIPLYMNYGAQWPMGNWFEGAGWWVAGDPKLHDRMVQSDTPFTLTDAYEKMINIARTFVEKGWVEPDLSTNNWEMSKGEVASGKAAMYFLGNWVIPQVIGAGAKPEDVGFFPFPYDNSGGPYNAPLGGDYYIGVSKNSKNKELAIKFLEFFVKESGYQDQSGFMPIYKDKQPNVPQLAEFKSFKPNLIEELPGDPRFNEIANKAEIPLWTGAVAQQLVKAKDVKAELDKLNKKWADAKKALGY